MKRHPALEPSQLKHLPPILKATALNAMSGSSIDMANLVNRIVEKDTKVSKRHFRYLLPVFCATIDPVDPYAILAAADSPIKLATLAETATRSIYAIRGLRRLFDDLFLDARDIPPADVLIDLIPRVVDWMQFHDTYWTVIHFCETPKHMYGSHLSSLATFARYPSVRDYILDRADVPRILGSAWHYLVEEQVEELSGALAIFEMFFMESQRRPGSLLTRSFVENLVLGAGGARALARICAAQLRLAFPDPDMRNDTGDAVHEVLRGILHLIVSDGAVENELIQHELAASDMVVSAARALHASLRYHPGSPNSMIRIECYSLLAHLIFIAPPPHARPSALIAGLRVGFLEDTFECWKGIGTTTPVGIAPGFAAHIQRDLPPILNSRAVIKRLSLLNPRVDDMAAAAISDPQLRVAWTGLCTLIKTRLRHYTLYTSLKADGEVLGGCDNIKCGQLHLRRSLKRCSKCHEAQYCSRSCQRRDWAFGHRQYCSAVAESKHGFKQYDAVSGIDSRGFLRTFLTRDHINCAAPAAIRLLDFFLHHRHTENPSAIPFLVFDYTSDPSVPDPGECEISVQCLICTKDLCDIYPEHLARAKASNGRYQMHFTVGTAGSLVPVPFYAPTGGGLYSGMERLAGEILRLEPVGALADSETIMKRHWPAICEVLSACAAGQVPEVH
ncbi:MYND-type domain-containing protein [Mycena kentingensis (nom. inval.)]|nr:MYND-type domain-containing protein [Mycena kentingensis (nom. inval.)]